LRGHFAEAEKLFRTALRDAQLNHDDYAAALNLCGLADIYQTQGDFPAAEAAYRKSLAIFRHGRDPNFVVGITLRNLGASYSAAGQYRQALETLNEAFRLAEAVQRPHLELTGQIQNSIGVVYFYKGDNRKAEHFFREATQTYSSAGPVLAADLGQT